MIDWTAAEIAARLRAREVSAREVAEASLARIEAVEPKIRAFLTVDREGALAAADAAQARLDEGDTSPLLGVPIAIKDNISTIGLRTTCASRILENYIPPYDAGAMANVRASGMVSVGKTNLDEFAMGSSCETSAFHPTISPWGENLSPGGSSGGSSAAVAASMVPVSLGSDTGGSIRLPAAVTGLVGFKPTYGRVSRYGLVAFGSSLDQIGPFGWTVEDVALVAEAISGHDPHDATSLPGAKISTSDLKAGSLKGLRIALPRQMFSSAAQPGVLAAVHAAIDDLRREGVEFTEVDIPEIDLGVTTYYIIAPAEASSNLARFDGVRYGPRDEGHGHVGAVAATRGNRFGHEVKSRIMIGTYALSAGYYDAYYVRAQQVRAKMTAAFNATFHECDVVLGPTIPCVAFKIGEFDQDPLALKLLDSCTIPANMGGFPAISLNAGMSDGLPVGMQLMGPVMGDERILQIAYAIQKALPSATVARPL
jgi:aspartyl-tRNA(Asn)/glutamyl-tRNA(Gln) amidotransferase subunit A